MWVIECINRLYFNCNISNSLQLLVQHCRKGLYVIAFTIAITVASGTDYKGNNSGRRDAKGSDVDAQRFIIFLLFFRLSLLPCLHARDQSTGVVAMRDVLNCLLFYDVSQQLLLLLVLLMLLQLLEVLLLLWLPESLLLFLFCHHR